MRVKRRRVVFYICYENADGGAPEYFFLLRRRENGVAIERPGTSRIECTRNVQCRWMVVALKSFSVGYLAQSVGEVPRNRWSCLLRCKNRIVKVSFIPGFRVLSLRVLGVLVVSACDR